MLRKLIEATLGPMTDAEFAEVMDLVETDVKINRTAFGKGTSLTEKVEIAVSCFIAMGRGKVA
jgi:hypothetical protein